MSAITEGNIIHGVEVAGLESDYGWQLTSDRNECFRHHTLFPVEDFHRISYPRLRSELWRCLDTIKPDVIVLPGWTSPGLAGLAWALARGIPRVLMSDSQKIDRPQTVVGTQVKRLLVSRFQAAFTAGSPHVQWLEELGLPVAKCQTGCDVVDNSHFRPPVVRDEQVKLSQKPVLLSCLRLIPSKNVIGVLNCLASHSPRWYWRIAGDGTQRAEIERRVLELGLSNRVELVGRVEYPELPAFYQSGDVYIQASRTEPWGLAVNEAMASGLPVLVSTRCGCHPDLVREGINGFTFDPGDQDVMAAVLERMWEKRAMWRAMGMASQSIITEWDLTRFATSFWKACQFAAASGGKLRSNATDKLVRLCLSGVSG